MSKSVCHYGSVEIEWKESYIHELRGEPDYLMMLITSKISTCQFECQ